MSLMLFVERLYMGVVVAALWLNRRRRLRRRATSKDADDENRPHDSNDLEAGGAERPMVLVQIPMFNEKQVRLAVIHSLCDILICVIDHGYHMHTTALAELMIFVASSCESCFAIQCAYFVSTCILSNCIVCLCFVKYVRSIVLHWTAKKKKESASSACRS
jgi:hypothetical protein